MPTPDETDALVERLTPHPNGHWPILVPAADLRALLAALREARGGDGARLREALESHGAHDASCGALCLLATNPPIRQSCTCGLRAALDAARAGSKR